MSTAVGDLSYSVTLDTGEMIVQQRKVEKELGKTASALDRLDSKLSQVASAVKIYAAAMAVIKAAQLADDLRLLSARVEVAAGSFDSGTVAMQKLVDISRRTQTAVEGNVEVFTRLNASILAMGGTQNDTLQITELLAKAIKVSGASAVEAKSAMVQFGQALGSGKLAGDELRSLLETAPYLMKQLADGLGVPIGALKKMGEEGKLTADVVTNAMRKAGPAIEEAFAKFPQTVGGALAVASDAAERANEKFDQLTGTSTALTGATKGLGEVLDKLADQFGAANTEAGKLGRNEAIKAWADSTKVALSYLVDAADLVWQTVSVLGRNVAYVLTGVGTEIGGIGAQVAAVMRGDFAGARAIGEAMKADAEQRRKELDAADAKTLSRAKLMGQQMREAWAAGAGAGRGFINPAPAASTLTAPTGGDDDKKAANEARRFETRRLAAQEYLAGLVADTKTALEKIDAEEQKALTENQKRRVADGKNAEIYAQAEVEIRKKYAKQRVEAEQKIFDDAAEVEERNEQARAAARILLTDSTEQRILLIREESVRQAEEAYRRGKITFEEMEAAKVKAAQDSAAQMDALKHQRDNFGVGTLEMKAGTSGGLVDQESAIIARAQLEMEQVEAQRQLDLENSQLYADRRVAIEQKMQADLAAARNAANQVALTSTQEIFGSLLSIVKDTAGEQSGIYKAMFAASKAFAIADSIIKIQQGIANASAQPFPLNLAAMASVAAATASIVSTISGTNYGGGRQYGGPVSAGSLYRVNEGGQPEMFTAANGSLFLMPNRSGEVIPAGKAGGGGPTIIIENNGPPLQVTGQTFDRDANVVRLAVAQAKSEIAGEIASNTGQVWGAMRASSNVRSRLS